MSKMCLHQARSSSPLQVSDSLLTQVLTANKIQLKIVKLTFPITKILYAVRETLFTPSVTFEYAEKCKINTYYSYKLHGVGSMVTNGSTGYSVAGIVADSVMDQI